MSEQSLNCSNCKFLASKTVTSYGMNGLLVGCRLHKKEIGIMSDLKKTKKCNDFKKRLAFLF